MNHRIMKHIEVVDNVATGAKARDARIKAGVTSCSVAKYMGHSSMYLSHLERGMRRFSIDKYNKFFEAIKALQKIKQEKA